jgi:hypothetical protein
MKIKALSLWQPWATAIALGKKRYETRSWKTSYRGRLLICSAKKPLDEVALHTSSFVIKGVFNPELFPLGVSICTCDLMDCLQITEDLIYSTNRNERVLGYWGIGRYAWKLENVVPVAPIPIKGYQGLFTVDYEGF